MSTCPRPTPHGGTQRATHTITAVPVPGGRRCASGWTCRADHDGHGAFVTGLPMCEPCLDGGARDLRALVYDYLDLEQLLGVKINTRGQDHRIAGTRELSVPYALGIDALQREIWHALTTWEEIVRDEVGLPEPAHHVRVGWAVQHAVAVLEPRVAHLVALGPVAVYLPGSTEPVDQTGVDAMLTFMALHRRSRVALGLTRRIEMLYGECSACGWAALRRESGSETVYCDHCHDSRTWDDYRRWLALLYADAKEQQRNGR